MPDQTYSVTIRATDSVGLSADWSGEVKVLDDPWSLMWYSSVRETPRIDISRSPAAAAEVVAPLEASVRVVRKVGPYLIGFEGTSRINVSQDGRNFTRRSELIDPYQVACSDAGVLMGSVGNGPTTVVDIPNGTVSSRSKPNPALPRYAFSKDRVFAAGGGSYPQYSDDFGVTWTEIPGLSFADEPINGSVAVCEGKVFITGKTWNNTKMYTLDASTLEVIRSENFYTQFGLAGDLFATVRGKIALIQQTASSWRILHRQHDETTWTETAPPFPSDGQGQYLCGFDDTCASVSIYHFSSGGEKFAYTLDLLNWEELPAEGGGVRNFSTPALVEGFR